MSCSNHICDWANYQTLLRKLEEASRKNDTKRMADIKIEIHNICQMCGAFPNPEIMRVLEDITLSESNVNYVRNSFNVIERCADQQDFKTINTLVCDINRITGCTCENCKHEEKIDYAMAMMRGFSSIQGNVSPMAAPNLEEDRREQEFPEFCGDGCKYITCPFRKQENFNLPCKQRWKPLRRSLDPDNMEE